MSGCMASSAPNEGVSDRHRDGHSIPRHVTIVTNGTAYIDGNLLKGEPGLHDHRSGP